MSLKENNNTQQSSTTSDKPSIDQLDRKTRVKQRNIHDTTCHYNKIHGSFQRRELKYRYHTYTII
jgi:hypothetical protein